MAKNTKILLQVSFVYLVILVLFFFPALRENNISSQVDHLYQFYPWKSFVSENIPDQNHLLADQSLGFLPWYKYIAATIKQGQLPLWNPYSLGGTPLIANLQCAFFYPLNWLYFVFSSDRLFTWLGIIKLLFAGVWTFLFFRCLHLSIRPSFLGGLLYMLSGFNILWLFHANSNVSIFLPCLMYLIERALHSQRSSCYWVFSTAVGIQVLGGHPGTSFYILFAASLYFFVRCVQLEASWKQRIKRVCKYMLALWLGMGVASCQLLPFFEYLSHSSMLFQRSRDLHAQGGGFSLAGFKVLITLFWPNFYGSPLSHNYAGPLNYNEINGAYIGILPLLLAITSIFIKNKRNIHKFFIALTVFCIIIIYRFPGIYHLIKLLPGFNMTNTHRLLLVLAFSNIVLCVFSLNTLEKKYQNNQVKNAGFILLCLIFTYDLFSFGSRYNPVVSKELMYPETETTRFLQQDGELFRMATPFSVFPHETHVPYNIASIRGYDALEIRTYTEFMNLLSDHKYSPYFVFATAYHNRIHSPLFDLLNVKYFIKPPEQELDMMRFPLVFSDEVNIYMNTSYLPRAFLISDYVVQEEKENRLALLADPAFSPSKILVLEDDLSYETKNISGSTLNIIEYQPKLVEIQVNALNDCFLVLSDNFFPGWEAYVNEKATPIYRAYHTFRAIRVPKGKSRVVFQYQPISFYIGMSLSIISLFILLFLFIHRNKG